MGTGVCLF